MTVPFEITGEHIAELNDSDLRSLIGLLCEADYRAAGLRTSGIKWGGHQNAGDGGLDVVVEDEITPPANSFVLRKVTGFQVKKSDMPRAKILEEMKPKGALRQEIKSLIDRKGAYVIVSSNGSVSRPALNSRIKAMKDAVSSERNACDLYLDFFDRGRIATWVRSHPSLIIWVRNKIDRPMRGWCSYGNWANAPGGIEEEYLLDNKLRLHDTTGTVDKGLTVEGGLLKIRSALLMPRECIRLAGLSGVGKTRFVQALFDSRIGERALNPSHAFYTDISDGPLPTPQELALSLVNGNTRAVLIVDNCPPELHRSLTQTCSVPGSLVSLLTVEYDIREDVPEETHVFRLEPASDGIIDSLVGSRFPHISPQDVQTIANFSGGNARIALLLAATVKEGEMLSHLRDEVLFERLFQQRHDPDRSLLVSAEACSLVYSFEGIDTSSDSSELKFLASLIGSKSVEDLYRDVAELKRRELVQLRGKWRAVLPHAIANRLARRALEFIPKEFLVSKFINSGNSRLIQSFARRLSYLHDCDIAVEIVNGWLEEGGWIGGSMKNLADIDIDLLANIAPVSPEGTLNAIERVAGESEGSPISARHPRYYTFVNLLCNLAYEAELFYRSAKLLCGCALSEGKVGQIGSASVMLKSLFQVQMSGTYASIESRAKVIEELVNSEDEDKQELGLLLLSVALETRDFAPYFRSDFGARSRDFGYEPQTQEELSRWFAVFIRICVRLALSGRPIEERARKLLASNFYGLWTRARIFDDLEESVREIHKRRAWNDGWIAVCNTIRKHNKDGLGNGETTTRLHQLEKFLKPDGLLEKARSTVLSDQKDLINLEEDFNSGESTSILLDKARKSALEIGAQVAQDPDLLNALLPDLATAEGRRLCHFGMGLAKGCADKRELLQALRDALMKTPPEERKVDVIQGFLWFCEENDPTFFNSVLDEMLGDEVLGEYLPFFQINVVAIDRRGVERLHAVLDSGKAGIHMFHGIALKHMHASISDDELALLLRKILFRKGGLRVAIENLKMRFGLDKRSSYSTNLLAVAREALLVHFSNEELNRRGNNDSDLAIIARVCLDGQEGIQCVTRVCQNISDGMKNYRISRFNYPELLSVLSQRQTEVFLDVFLLSECETEYYLQTAMFSGYSENWSNPLDEIADEVLISWCETDPYKRYPLLASAITPLRKSNGTGKYEWKSLVFIILEKSPDLSTVLKNLEGAIDPTGGWGYSFADIYQERTSLFIELKEHSNPEVRNWAESQLLLLQGKIARERNFEEHRRREDEGFE